MDRRIEEVVRELEMQIAETREQFSELSERELNWKPDKNSWSVAQCLDHLITTHSLYFPIFAALASERRTPSFWERTSPFSRFWGKYFVRLLDPGNQKKIKTTSKAQPASSQIDEQIVERYCAHQNQLIENLSKIPADIDPEKTIVTSPLLGIVTYSLDDVFTMLVVHGQRHFLQAKRVKNGLPES